MKPENANPGNFTVQQIVYTSSDGGFSIAKGYWVEDEMDRFAMRWNGKPEDPSDVGYPSVFAHPMWFQLPYDMREMLAALIQHSNPIQL